MELRDPIAEALAFVAELDALDAMATTSREQGWVLPDVIDAEGVLVEADGLVHPFVESAVPNPVALDRDGPLIFLTGPNMAGKTTWMRAVGVGVLLAQAGMGVPARRMRIAPAEALFSSLHPTDDLQEGRSTFMAEVLRVRAAAELLAEGNRALILFDEAFRGTNVLDARDASLTVIRGFRHARRGATVFSSHLADLAEELRGESGIRFRRFEGRVVEGEPRFDYTLQEGVSEQRFGMLLLRRAGIPDLLARIEGGHHR
jgi:DNA mismatch repair ATPase MutS